MSKEKFNYITVLFETINRNRYMETTNGFTEGCHTKIKMMKRVSFGFRNINNYIAKMMLAFIPLFEMTNYLLNHHTV